MVELTRLAVPRVTKIAFVAFVCVVTFGYIVIYQNKLDFTWGTPATANGSYVHKFKKSQSVTNRTKLKTILLWNKFFKEQDFGFGGLGRTPFVNNGCPVTSCQLVTDKARQRDADAVLFHARQSEPGKWRFPQIRPAGQVYVFFLRESPMHTELYYWPIKSAFNVTMTYRRDSDIPVPVSEILPVKEPQPAYSARFPLATRNRSVAWVVSHCTTPSKRERYAHELGKYIDVDIFGKCGEAFCPKKIFGGKPAMCYREFLPSRYKFYLSFENSICQDYVTEKVFRPLDTELVPIVYGGTNYTRDMPPHSVIDIKDFPSPKALAEHLIRLGRNETEYRKYFEWKNKYFVDILHSRRVGICQLCKLLHDGTFSKTYSNVYEWWTLNSCAGMNHTGLVQTWP